MGNTNSSSTHGTVPYGGDDELECASVGNNSQVEMPEAASCQNTLTTEEAVYEERKKQMMADIIQQTRSNFQSALSRAGDLSRQSAQTEQSQGSSVPDSAHRLNGLMLASEGLLRDPVRMFQDMVVKLAEERAREQDTQEPSTPTTPTAIHIPEPLGVAFLLPIPAISNATVDITSTATPLRYRFVDCSSLVHEHTLRVVEYDNLSDLPYATTSYIWRGITGPPPSSMARFGTFSVAGATDGDPISLDVLLHVARACLFDNIPLVWLDRLCIMQTNKEDKSWQIQKMYNIYASCGKCYILPGGTRRLASLEEPTMWIHRGWTLQEAVAPKKCSVVIQWAHPGGTFANPHQRLGTTGCIDEIVPGESSQVPLSSLLMASVAETVEFRVRCTESFRGRQVDIRIRIFGSDEAGRRHAFALAAAMKPAGDSRDPRGVRKNTALWRSAMMRTSSRPVDMVFSIMGLFGVTLNPKDFQAHDRLGATIALAQEILKQGGSPNWLTMSLALPQNPALRSFPAFPETDVAGTAVYAIASRRVEAAELMGDIDGWLGTEDIPGAHMDVHGLLTFKALSVPVRWTGVFQPQAERPRPQSTAYTDQLLQFHNSHVPPFIVDNDGKVWKIVDREQDGCKAPNTYAVVLGRMYTWSSSRFFDPQALTRAVLLEEYGEGKFCRPERASWFTFNSLTFRFESWEERMFTI
ncbi:HET-domain-containing protein [Mycena sanguinolenta]|uniref:HET-domain-containing protein n=1 Tax=Mycena sanguinolenta TaxID=230812 RepID=A0A8H6ZCC3_9AGAR|nr:HET-domain-containing protein [Mycena sanguinolenta]